MRKIILFVATGILAASIASSSVSGTVQSTSNQIMVDVDIVCPSRAIVQDGKIVKVMIKSCQILPHENIT